ncbi:MAG TPA: outer membrane beta-barrel protein [Puia sp.]|nr:outer membrane beta-barrel protein [Puia sp.]
MKKYFFTAVIFLATTAAFGQKKRHKNPPPPAKDTVTVTQKPPAVVPPPPPAKTGRDWSKVNLSKRAADHFMLELGYDNWINTPDSVNIRGFNHSVNFYFLYDFPFKSDARFSVGAGLGIGSSNIYFDQTYPQVAAYQNQTLAFTPAGGGDHFKRFKLTTVYLEVPVELRFALDPEHMDKSWKFAVGTKIGLMVNAYTKGVTAVNSVGQTLGNITIKQYGKQFFNTPKLAATARISKGVVGVFGQLQINSLVKATAGTPVFPFSFGIVLSGL